MDKEEIKMDTRTWVALAALLLTLVGGTVAAIDYFAKEVDLKLVEYRLDQKIRDDQAYNIQQQIWQLEDRYLRYPVEEWPQPDRDRYRKLKHRLEVLKKGH